MTTSKSISNPKIVIVDGYTLNPYDLSWEPLQELGEVRVFERSTPDEIVERAREAEIILANKAVFDEKILEQLPQLRCICVTATGYNNIDVNAAKAREITVCNVAGYGTESVAQHVFALLLELTNAVGKHNQSVQEDGWAKNRDFSYTVQPILELAGKTMGIYGLGSIGQRVAKIALAFGMKVIAKHKHPKRDAMPGVGFVDLETLFQESDVITLHAPLTDENQGVVNKHLLAMMKPGAYLINTARGGLINEPDLKEALEKNIIAGAALDVLSQEPPKDGNTLIGVNNCIITPHNAWASREARQRLLNETINNVKAFLHGTPRNVVNA